MAQTLTVNTPKKNQSPPPPNLVAPIIFSPNDLGHLCSDFSADVSNLMEGSRAGIVKVKVLKEEKPLPKPIVTTSMSEMSEIPPPSVAVPEIPPPPPAQTQQQLTDNKKESTTDPDIQRKLSDFLPPAPSSPPPPSSTPPQRPKTAPPGMYAPVLPPPAPQDSDSDDDIPPPPPSILEMITAVSSIRSSSVNQPLPGLSPPPAIADSDDDVPPPPPSILEMITAVSSTRSSSVNQPLPGLSPPPAIADSDDDSVPPPPRHHMTMPALSSTATGGPPKGVKNANDVVEDSTPICIRERISMEETSISLTEKLKIRKNVAKNDELEMLHRQQEHELKQQQEQQQEQLQQQKVQQLDIHSLRIRTLNANQKKLASRRNDVLCSASHRIPISDIDRMRSVGDSISMTWVLGVSESVSVPFDEKKSKRKEIIDKKKRGEGTRELDGERSESLDSSSNSALMDIRREVLGETHHLIRHLSRQNRALHRSYFGEEADGGGGVDGGREHRALTGVEQRALEELETDSEGTFDEETDDWRPRSEVIKRSRERNEEEKEEKKGEKPSGWEEGWESGKAESKNGRRRSLTVQELIDSSSRPSVNVESHWNACPVDIDEDTLRQRLGGEWFHMSRSYPFSAPDFNDDKYLTELLEKYVSIAGFVKDREEGRWVEVENSEGELEDTSDDDGNEEDKDGEIKPNKVSRPTSSRRRSAELAKRPSRKSLRIAVPDDLESIAEGEEGEEEGKRGRVDAEGQKYGGKDAKINDENSGKKRDLIKDRIEEIMTNSGTVRMQAMKRMSNPGEGIGNGSGGRGNMTPLQKAAFKAQMMKMRREKEEKTDSKPPVKRADKSSGPPPRVPPQGHLLKAAATKVQAVNALASGPPPLGKPPSTAPVSTAPVAPPATEPAAGAPPRGPPPAHLLKAATKVQAVTALARGGPPPRGTPPRGAPPRGPPPAHPTSTPP